MKLIKAILTFGSLYLFLFATQSNLSSCQKPPPEIIRDTVIIRDTIRIVDSSSCNCYDLKDGLVAWYNFKQGTLKDSSGNNNHIVLNNNTTLAPDRFGKTNGAYLFNGSSSYMKVANSASLNPANGITLSGVFKVNAFYTGNCSISSIFAKVSNEHNPGFYSLRIVATTGCTNPIDFTKELLAGVYGNPSANQASASDADYAQTNKWYYLVYTYANGESKIYVDGVLKKTMVQPGNAAFTPSIQDLFIGKMDDATYPYWFNGVIDDIRIYNKTLCAAAVTQLYNLKE